MQDIITTAKSYNTKDVDSIKKFGVVFTNEEICDEIISNIQPKINENICEPSVGKGIFVFRLLQYFQSKKHNIDDIARFVENNLYVFDINIEFLNTYKELLKRFFKYNNYNNELKLNNIHCQDFLLHNKNHYDVIIGNPPYIRIQNLKKDYLNILKNGFKSMNNGNVDIYYAFVENAIKYSTRFGFIIPNNFIKNKSGKTLKELLNDKLTYLNNFENDKKWKGISTYTCIIICDDNIPTKIVFNDVKSHGKYLLSDLYDGHQGSLATIKDSVYKIDLIDDEYCYKIINDVIYKIEKGICKKIFNVSKNKHTYIIYPYTDGKIISEKEMIDNYPQTFNYLTNQKQLLLSRDRGKVDRYDTWYAYGRKQGLYRKTDDTLIRILLPMTFKKSSGLFYIKVDSSETILTLSGFSIYISDENLKKFDEIIKTNDFLNFLEKRNKILKGSGDDIYITLNITSLKEYKYETETE